MGRSGFHLHHDSLGAVTQPQGEILSVGLQPDMIEENGMYPREVFVNDVTIFSCASEGLARI